MTYRKVGGLHFVRLGRFGFSFYVSKPKLSCCRELVPYRKRVWFDKLDAIALAAMIGADIVLAINLWG